MPPAIILASSSPYRQQLLRQLQLPFTCQSPNIDETQQVGESAKQLVLRLAQEKAACIARQHPDCWIIGSDQVATIDDDILTKPGNFERAKQQLSQQSGRQVLFHTGLCLSHWGLQRHLYTVNTTQVSFRQLSGNQIDSYLIKETPYDCAGSFKAEGLGISLFEKIDGDDPNSLIGLPLIQLAGFFQRVGLDPLTYNQQTPQQTDA